ncbi:MAG: M28 family peptidase [Acidobacteriota bacterium]|nr:M28 family peptidase [Acidobacteriota bacterium]
MIGQIQDGSGDRMCPETPHVGLRLLPRHPLLALPILLCGAFLTPAQIGPAEQSALSQISADSLRTNLAYIASDGLQGRFTPSPGLTKAASYIAGQFKQAGLAPAVNGSYFQIAPYAEFTPKLDDFHLTLKTGGTELTLAAADVRVRSPKGLDLADTPVVIPPDGEVPAGKVIAAAGPKFTSDEAISEYQASKPALILLVSRRPTGRRAPASYIDDAAGTDAPVIRISSPDLYAAIAEHKPLTLSIHLSAPASKPAPVENVIGVLPGSDPKLRDEYVVVSAHYDHLGVRNGQIYNGANDNGSGTVSVIEIAKSLATLNPRPKRTIVFMTFFGEEEGLLGAYFYTHHPVFPLAKTVADINLEQMGRTDDRGATHYTSFSFTGPSYSDLPAAMTAAAKREHIGVYVKSDADDFFDRSDNYPFAEAGVVAHTAVVAYEYPDYHAPGDKPDKIDYKNMAAVDRGVAAGVLAIADRAEPPHWADEKKAAPYREAATKAGQ